MESPDHQRCQQCQVAAAVHMTEISGADIRVRRYCREHAPPTWQEQARTQLTARASCAADTGATEVVRAALLDHLGANHDVARSLRGAIHGGDSRN
jgi:hypothetical protein